MLQGTWHGLGQERNPLPGTKVHTPHHTPFTTLPPFSAKPLLLVTRLLSRPDSLATPSSSCARREPRRPSPPSSDLSGWGHCLPSLQALRPSHLLPGLPFLPRQLLPQTPCFAFLSPQLSTALTCSAEAWGLPYTVVFCAGEQPWEIALPSRWPVTALTAQWGMDGQTLHPVISWPRRVLPFQKEEKTKRPEKNLNALHPPLPATCRATETPPLRVLPFSHPALPQPSSTLLSCSPPRSTQKPLEKAAFPVSTSSSLLTLPALKPLQPRFCSQRPTEASPEASSSLATCKGHVSVLILRGLPATSGLFFSPPSLKHSFSLALVTPYVALVLKCTSGGPVKALGGCRLCSGLGTACSVLPAWQGPRLPAFGNSFSSSPLGSQLRCRKPPLTPLTPAGPGTLPGSPDALFSPCCTLPSPPQDRRLPSVEGCASLPRCC